MSYLRDPRAANAYRLGLTQPIGRGYYGRFEPVAGPRVVSMAPPTEVTAGMPAWLKWVLGGAAVAAGAYALHQSSESVTRSKDSRFGFDSEFDTADELVNAGARRVDVSPGSRGAIDVDARWPQSRWAIQQKSSRRGQARIPGPDERLRLIQAAERKGARPVIALREGRRPNAYLDARTLVPIDPPRR